MIRRWWIFILLLLLWSLPLAAFQTAPLVENCNRVENPLTSGWLGNVDPDITGAMTANGTVCTPESSLGASTYWGLIQPADQVITIIAADASTTSTHSFNLIVRLQQPSPIAQTADYYRCEFAPAIPQVRIARILNGGSSVAIAGPITFTTNTGDGLGCQVIGDTISLWHQPGGTGPWAMLISAVDGTITGQGHPGLHLTHNQLSADTIGFGVPTSTRLSLHATAEEAAIWLARTTAGPYTAEWTRILGRANTFVATPEPHWLGNQLSVAWNGDAVEAGTQVPNVFPDGSQDGGDRTPGDELRDAAFVSLVTGNTSYRTPVITWLLAQAAISGTQFSNTTKWSPSYTTLDKDFAIAIWLRKVTYAYSHVRSAMSSSEKVTMDAWLNGAGTYWALVLHNSAKLRFPNRLTGDYTTTFTCVKPVGGSSAVTHFGGWEIDQFGFPWDNKRMNFAAAVTAIGVTTNNATLMTDGKRYFKEWLRSNIFPDGTSWEQARWTTGNPQSGFNYGLTVVGSAATIADHLARVGDTELYTYTTSLGNCGSEGGPKSLLQVLQRYANIALGNTLVYASLTATSDPTLLIDSSGPGGTLYNDVNLAQPNVFYQDPLLESSYTRTMPDTWNSGGYDGLGGDWGHLPAARFMFGQMEGLVWPYASEGIIPSVPWPGIHLLPAPVGVAIGSSSEGGIYQGGSRR